MTTIDKIRQEVERLKHENDIWRERINSEEGYSYESDICCGYEEAINDFEKFLDTFKEEPLGLNEAAKAYENSLSYHECMSQWPSVAFKAGAEWILNHNLTIVNNNIKRAEKCLDESTGYDEYPYWDGACDMANAIRREIEGIKTE